MGTMKPLVCVLVLSSLLYYSSQMDMKNMPIGVLLPGHSDVDSKCLITAIQLAVDEVNKADYIQYEQETFHIIPIFHKTSNNTEDVLKLLTAEISGPNPPLMLIGPAYHTQASPVGEVTSNYFINTFQYTTMFRDRSYPFYLQMAPPAYYALQATPSLLKYFNWTRAAVLLDSSDQKYIRYIDLAQLPFINNDIEVLSQEIFTSMPADSSVHDHVHALERKGARVIIALMGIKGARKIFCEAYRRKIFKPKVVWILLETLAEGWASDMYNAQDGREIECTEEELLKASDGYISFQKTYLRSDGVPSDLNGTGFDFMRNMTERLGEDVSSYCNIDIPYAYDAVLLAAYIKRYVLEKTNTLHPLRQRLALQTITSSHKSNYYLEGITGPIQFANHKLSTEMRYGEFSILVNNLNENPEFIGTYHAKPNTLKLGERNDTIHALFKDGQILADGPRIEINHKKFKTAVVSTMWSLAAVGIILTVVIAIINFFHLCKYDTSEVEDPIIDCLLLFGSILCYLSVIIYGLDMRYIGEDDIPKTCSAFVVVLTVGFTFLFGSMLAKIWQFYSIHNNNDEMAVKKGQEIKVPGEWKLCIMIGIFLIADAIVLLVWYTMSPFEKKVEDISDPIPTLFVDVITKKHLVRCECDDRINFTIAMYCYKGLYVVFALFFSWQSSHSSLSVVTGAKDVAMAICNVAIVSVIGIVCTSILEETSKYDVMFIIVSVCIIISVTTSLILVFYGKIQNVFCGDSVNVTTTNKKSGGSVFKRSTTKNSQHHNYKQRMTSSSS